MSNSNGCKMIALDMDGTLLRSDKTIHPDTAADIAEAAAAGIEVIYCTGRSPVEVLPYRQLLPTMRYAVCLSGAYVCDLAEKRCIHEACIPQELVLRLIEEADRHGAMAHILTNDRSIVRADLIDRMAEFHMASYQSLYRKVARGVPDMTAEALRHKGVHKVNIYFQDPRDRRTAFAVLQGLPLTIALTEETMFEASAKGVSKVEGLLALARYLKIPMSSVMAVGDSENDLTVLESAGLSIAMQNAEKKVISLCDAVTADNDHNGVGQAIRKYCLSAVHVNTISKPYVDT